MSSHKITTIVTINGGETGNGVDDDDSDCDDDYDGGDGVGNSDEVL